MKIKFDIPQGRWGEYFLLEFQKPYVEKLELFLSKEASGGHEVYPQKNNLFSAFNLCPFEKLKVVIVGQDPYHGAGQAHGLAFSVPDGVVPPPSLKNIYKELHDDLHFKIPQSGNLSSWAQQGVLLLNTILTVGAGKPASHQSQGWETFTDAMLKNIADEKRGIVFLLWGKSAQEKASSINASKHFILKAAHPSPFSAYRGFFGCKHFSRTNQILEKKGIAPIDWNSVNESQP